MQGRAGQSLKLSQLRLIAAIDRHRQIVNAARALGISQPAASRSLAEIEALIGTPLFERHPRGMIPTTTGEIVARRAQAMLTALSDLGRELDEMQGGKAGVVRIGAVTGPALGCVVPALKRLKAESPRIEVVLEVASSAALLPMLEQGALDVLVARVPAGHSTSGLTIEPGIREAVECLIRSGHPLAGKGAVPIAEAATFPWVLQDRGAPIRVAVEQALWSAGLAPPADVVASQSPLVSLALAADTDAICPVSREVARLAQLMSANAYKTLELMQPIELTPCHMITLSDRQLSPGAEQMVGLLREQIGDLAE